MKTTKKDNDRELTDLEMDLAAKLIGKEMRELRPEFKAMSDEELRRIFNSKSEPDIRRVTAKLEGMCRHGFGPNDRIH